jgi:multiple sugar transport system ATP-binding protein
MGATTVYVTHDQLEAMQMGDKIVVMNHGVVEQFGAPQDIYDKPATMFVADFIGAPAMNFLPFSSSLKAGATVATLGDAEIDIPRQHQAASGELVLGVRPEHVRLSDTGALRAEVLASEYLGTTQILTLQTSHGPLKARIPAADVVRTGERVGLDLTASTLTVFEATSGRALKSDLNAEVLQHG